MNDDSTELSTRLRSRLAGDSLWDFALALYARDGIEPACLTLQDEAGIDVAELLWHCWLYQHGLRADDTPSDVRQWQRTVTTPLRDLRRELKPAARERSGVATVRQHIKQAELDAERECLLRLEAHSRSGSVPLSELPRPCPTLEKVLPFGPQLQKKSHLLALGTLQSQLDPLYPPR
ncbi:TIGR02444 family protein [Halomonas caseinilytica]|uniref:TIGR02444 family protein n=1 Tax=Halomonas caseinilytica TaxID=438744 RepID=A0A1M6W3J0_9GAMM|nr:TIGR02444 family protein [Halomonas caseinilytica]SEM79771.1 TIGR02444 family protein [Halomonas caseinilytica]SHK88085.1 TIGR02444 family protein [Halomonas caseinilytica]